MVVVLVGACTIVAQVIGWVHPSGPVSPHGPADADFRAAAVVTATDYLTWSQADRSERPTVSARFAPSPPQANPQQSQPVDGWNGVGRQWADSAAAVAVLRIAPDAALVTVNTRVSSLPVVGDTTSGTDPGASASTTAPATTTPSAKNPSISTWPLGRSRWVMLTVALAWRDARFVLTGLPALVGSPPATAPVVQRRSDTGDAAFAESTRDAVVRLLTAYGTGDLEFVRAPGTRFTGLGGVASLHAVTSWQVAPASADARTRTGVATVVWQLVNDAGSSAPAAMLTCAYRIDLRWQDDRWLLQSITGDWGTL
ncbi:hypothetical protein [Labedaea rhizosphaerae]|uniref:hypothetical protein n=1 Tax=Labedaea rhizosphaerae TaxID=598644 RepID=UPI00105BD9FD|nr:hypothetical protein [Labedaea rhizosphaerae]